MLRMAAASIVFFKNKPKSLTSEIELQNAHNSTLKKKGVQGQPEQLDETLTSDKQIIFLGTEGPHSLILIHGL